MDYKQTLLSPIKIGNFQCKNRFFIQAMECCDADEKGNPSELTYRRYENLFKGDAGMITLEAVSITRESRSRDDQLMIMTENAQPLKKFLSITSLEIRSTTSKAKRLRFSQLPPYFHFLELWGRRI